MKQISINDKIDILNDKDNYYFFRALNNGDIDDIAKGLTLDKEGKIIKIRTDQERYQEIPKYNLNSQISLEEVFDHIKPYHRKDTNCISLTINANVALLYGREYYQDKYILVTLSKNNKTPNIINAFSYLTNEINQQINSLLHQNKITPNIKQYLEIIDKCQDKKSLEKAIHTINVKEINFIKKYKLAINNDTLVEFESLNESQKLEKDKMIVKLTILDMDIIPNIPNKDLIETIINAYSSQEFIHYKTIKKEDFQEIKKEIVDLLALIQQIPTNFPNLQIFKQEILKLIKEEKLHLKPFTYHSYHLKKEKELENNNIILTNGIIANQETSNIYIKTFYLAKSKLRSIETITQIKPYFEKNKNNQNIINYLQTNTYGTEPQIFSNQHSSTYKINDFVSLNFSEQEKSIFEFINILTKEELQELITNPIIILDYYLKFRNTTINTLKKKKNSTNIT